MYENDVKIDRKMHTKVLNDWAMEFPTLKKHKSVLRRRVGPLMISMWYYTSYGTNMKPNITYFNLSHPLEFMCANLSIEPKSRRYSLTWLQHEKGLYKEAAAELRQLAPIPIEGSVTLSQIINAYKNYAGHITDERHFEDPALIAAWAGQRDLAEQCLEWGLEAYQKNRKVPYQGTSFCDWYQSMSKKIANPEALQKTVEEQVIYHKLTKIPYEELVIDYA